MKITFQLRIIYRIDIVFYYQNYVIHRTNQYRQKARRSAGKCRGPNQWARRPACKGPAPQERRRGPGLRLPRRACQAGASGCSMRPMFALAHMRRPLRGRSALPACRTAAPAHLAGGLTWQPPWALPWYADTPPRPVRLPPLRRRSLAADKPRTPPTRPLNMHEAVERALHSNPACSQEAQSKSTERNPQIRAALFGLKLGMSYTATRTG